MFPVVLVKWVPSVFAIIDSEVSKMHYFFFIFLFLYLLVRCIYANGYFSSFSLAL